MRDTSVCHPWLSPPCTVYIINSSRMKRKSRLVAQWKPKGYIYLAVYSIAWPAKTRGLSLIMGGKSRAGHRDVLALQRQFIEPRLHVLRGHARGKAHAFEPFARAGQFSQQFAALAKARAGGGAEGDDRLIGKIVGFHKGVYRPGGDAPPDGIADENGVVLIQFSTVSATSSTWRSSGLSCS